MATISKQTAIVTGGSKGIGKGIATELVSLGYKVAITARTQESAAQAAEKIPGYQAEKVIGLAFDMEQPNAAQQLIDNAISEMGHLDVLVNNALSKSINAPILHASDEEIDLGINANISCIVKLCKHAHPHLKATRGSILNVGSSVTKRYVTGLPLYTMAKASLVKLTEALAAEWYADGIRINAVNPGFTFSDAPKDRGLNEAQIEKLYNHTSQFQPLGTLEPEDIAPIIGLILSEKGKKITGAVFDIDGGHHIQGHSLRPTDL